MTSEMIGFTILTSDEAGDHEQTDSPELPFAKDSNLGQNLVQVSLVNSQVNMSQILHGQLFSSP